MNRWHDKLSRGRISLVLLGLMLSACGGPEPRALGTLEWDRVVLPATANEPIRRIDVVVGQRVAAGDALLSLDPAHAEARRAIGRAEVERLHQQLAVLQIGARSEDRDAARARVAELRALAVNADQQLARTRALVAQRLLAQAELDRALSNAHVASAALAGAEAARDLLRHGSRAEDIAQAEAALRAADGQLQGAEIDLERLQVRAPRSGRIDALPYKVGDQPAVGAPLVVMLVGAAPYARVYVLEPQRSGLSPGQPVQVQVAGSERVYRGRVRTIQSEPSFTPYYALTGKDAARLSYLAEVDLGADAAELPAGLPVGINWTTPAPAAAEPAPR